MADDAQYISEMDLAIPLPNGPAGEGDDEIRATKRAVQQTMVGNSGNVVWSSVPDWVLADPDPYDIPVVLGPRAINALPKSMETITSAITDLDTRVDGAEAAIIAIAAIPVGVIVMWSGTLGTIPSGWALCDGTQGTPNLEGRFILGSGALAPPGLTGGNPNTGPGTPHSHTVTVGAHALTIGELPDLTGAVQANLDASSQADDHSVLTAVTRGRPGAATWTDLPVRITGPAGTAHTHGGSTTTTEGAHTHVGHTPNYYVLAYIMYKG